MVANIFLRLLPIFPVVICAIVSIYGNYKLSQCRNEMFVKKRPSSLVLNTVMIIGMFGVVLAYISTELDKPGVTVVVLGLFLLIWCVIFLILNVKNWIIFFRYKWTYFALKFNWQRIINADTSNAEEASNWFINNNVRFGCLSFVYFWFGLFHFLGFSASVCLMASRALMTTMSEAMSITFGALVIILLFVPVVVYMVIVCKTPRLKDTFSIHWESRMHAKVALALVVGCFVVALTKSVSDDHTMSMTVAIFSIPYALFGMVYLSTFSVMSRNGLPQDALTEKAGDVEIFSRSDNAEHAYEPFISLKGVLCNAEATNLFMVYLGMEYSMECLLSLIEFVHFQQYIFGEMKHQERITLPDDFKIYDISDSLPRSVIVQNRNLSPKMKAIKLYEKYVESGAEHEINISSDTRRRLIWFLHDPAKWRETEVSRKQLLLLFKPLLREMQMLLHLSLLRFRTQPEFDAVISIFSDNKIRTPKRSPRNRPRTTA